MEEFEFRAQYSPSATPEAFEPVEAVDTTQLMERNQRIEEDNMRRRLKETADEMERQEIALASVNEQQLEQIAQFSQTAFKTLTSAAQEFQKKQAEDFFAEGMDDANKMLAQNPDFDADEEALRLEDEQYQADITKQQKAGLPNDVAARLRTLSGWARYGYLRGSITALGDGYSGFLDQAFRTDNQKLELDGETFTIATAKGVLQKRMALNVLQKKYFRMNGMGDVSPAMLNKYAMDQMRKAEASVLSVEREEETKNLEAEQRATATGEFTLDARRAPNVKAQAGLTKKLMTDFMTKGGMTAHEARVAMVEAVYTHASTIKNPYERQAFIDFHLRGDKDTIVKKPYIEDKLYAGIIANKELEFRQLDLKLDQVEEAERQQVGKDWTQQQLDLIEQTQISTGRIPDDAYIQKLRTEWKNDPVLSSLGRFPSELDGYPTREQMDLEEQKAGALADFKEDSLTLERLNNKYPLLLQDEKFIEMAKQTEAKIGGDGRYTYTGWTTLEKGLHATVVETAGLNAPGMKPGVSTVLMQQQVTEDLHKRAAEIKSANKDKTWAQSYQEAALSLTTEIKAGAGNPNSRYGLSGYGSAASWSMFPNSTFGGREEAEKLARINEAHGRTYGLKGLEDNTNGHFSKEEIDALTNPQADEALQQTATFKLRNYIDAHNRSVNRKDEKITYSQGVAALNRSIGNSSVQPKKDPYEEVAQRIDAQYNITQPTVARANKLGVIGNLPPAEIRTGTQGAYDVSLTAIHYGLPEQVAPIAGAVWALESGWGNRESGDNNYFGIKGEGTVRDTQEYSNGSMVSTSAEFKDYRSKREGIGDFVKLLQKPRYAAVLTASTPLEALQALKAAGYATDPDYVSKTSSILRDMGINPKRPFINQNLTGAGSSNPATMGAAARDFITGNTGVGTGAHVHVALNNPDQVKVNPSLILDNLYVNGKPLRTQFAKTSGYGPRTAPTPGASTFHQGIDFATPTGTRISVRGARYMGTSYDKKSGYYNIYRLPNGYEILLMHGHKSNAG